MSKKEVIIAKNLQLKDLQKIIEGKILALKVPNYFSPKLYDDISKRLLTKKYEYYDYAKGVVRRYGFSFSETEKSKKNFKHYYSNSTSNIRIIRKIFAPYLSPIDKLRLELEEIWSAGALQENLHKDYKMFVGLCRVIEPHKEVLPHQDVIQWDSNNNKKALEIKSQLTVNVYLQVPKVGGELEIWDYQIKNKKEYEKLAKGSYGISRKIIPKPKIILKPKVGDLIIFNPQNLHCIKESDRKRITMSCFIGYRSKSKPLTYWS